MKTMRSFAFGAAAAAMLLALGGCAGMSTQGKNTAIGAGAGAVGGALLTGGARSEPSVVQPSAESLATKSPKPNDDRGACA